MIYLFLSVLCSSLIFLLFRAFKSNGISNFPAIVINYFVAGLTGLILNGALFSISEVSNSNWLIYALFLGVIFISLFNIMAITAQKLGASVASIANKMALIIPVAFAILFYDEKVNTLKISGIVMALIGVYWSTLKPSENKALKSKKLLLIPLLLFLGSGFIDTLLNYVEFKVVESSSDTILFTSFTFITAFCVGLLVLIIDKKKRDFSAKTLLAGFLLGLINFGSIYFLLKAISQSNLEGSVIFPINNMAVVLLTTLFSALLFHEQFSWKNKVGVLLSILSIVLISIA